MSMGCVICLNFAELFGDSDYLHPQPTRNFLSGFFYISPLSLLTFFSYLWGR